MAGEYRNGMLGTLRSELDDSEDEAIHQAFEALESMCSLARAAYLDFRMTPESAAGLFQELRLVASDGQEWTVGSTSGTWFHRGLGTSQWYEAPLPLGLVPVFRGPQPSWLSAGIESFISETRMVPVEPTELSGRMIGADDSLVPEPVSPSPAVPIPAAPKATTSREDLDWLAGEWDDFDQNLKELRTLRTNMHAKPVPAKLPETLPTGWDADKALTDAVRPSSAIASREGSSPSDPGWTPPERGEYTSPGEFFLPPED